MKNLKKKVALLLALVMMLSLVPMNVFGAEAINVQAPTRVVGVPGQDNNVPPTTARVTFDVPASVFFGISTQSEWDALDLLVQLNGDRGALTGADVTIPSVTWVNAGTVTGPAIVAGIGAPAHRFFAFAHNDTAAYGAGLTNMPGNAVLRIAIEVAGIVDARTAVSASLTGLPHAGTVNLLASTRVLTRIAPVGEPPAANFTAAVGGATNLLNIRTEQGVGHVTFTERVAAPTAPATFTITLYAPRGYKWVTAGEIVTSHAAINGFAGFSQALGDSNISDSGHRIEATVNIPSRGAGPLAAQLGSLRLQGMRLEPIAGHTLRVENLEVTLDVRRGEDRIVYGDRTFVIARQQIRGTTITAAAAPVINSGIVPGGSVWNTAVITVTEGGAGSILDAPILLQLNTPGVTVAAARIRNTAGGGNEFPGNDEWRTAQVSGDTIIAPAFAGGTDRGIARTIEIQLRLNVAPGLGNANVPATVTVMTHPDTATWTGNIAEIVDPITLSVDQVREIPIRSDSDLAFLPARRLGTVTIEPKDKDVFGLDNEFHVFLRAVDSQGNPFTLPVLTGLSWNVAASVEGEDFRMADGVVYGQALARVPHAFAGFTFRLDRVGEEVPSVSFASTLTGAIISEPGIEFEFVVYGSAIQAQDATAAQRTAYRAVVGRIIGELVLGEQPPAEAPPEAPPVQPPAVSEPAKLTVDRASVNSLLQPNFVGNLVNLRGLFESVIPNGSLTRANSVSTFSAPQADGGPMVQIMVPDPRLNEPPFIRIAGQPVSPIVAAGFGLTVIDGTWYVPVSVFTDLFGYLIG